MKDVSWNNTTMRDGVLLDVELEHITVENRLLLGFVRKQNNGLQLILFSFFIFILFSIILHLSIFRTLGLGLEVIGYTVTSVTFDGVVTTLITGLKKKK